MIITNKSKPARFFRTALAAAFFALVAVIFGSYVRLSEANIGCPDGPACAGEAVAPAKTENAVRGRDAKQRPWKDMVTRYVAGALGLLLIRLAVLGWQLRRRPGQQVIIPVITLFLVFGLTAASVFTIDQPPSVIASRPKSSATNARRRSARITGLVATERNRRCSRNTIHQSNVRTTSPPRN